ncbi:hypothetical protein Ocin01_04630 [Orchesella cincta]|uniref:Uncharacterized protein n=1 Tax=Orchesella cincta TaxID=48709 RepID=A0A1D2N9V3_ORCCI|nr:hypothetical protein Ocin01_04630 [Orchesella cincta]
MSMARGSAGALIGAGRSKSGGGGGGRRKSQGGGSSGGSGNNRSTPAGNGLNGPGGIYGQGRPIFLNDETLLVSDKDRKSLPRGLRPKFSYGTASSGVGSMLSPGPVSSTSGYQIPPGGLGRSSGSSGGSTASRGGNYTSTTDETSFILMSAGPASAAIHPHYDYDYDLVAPLLQLMGTSIWEETLGRGKLLIYHR